MKSEAKNGNLHSEITIFKSYIGILRGEGFKPTILSLSEKNPGLVKVNVSWDLSETMSAFALQDYISGKMVYPNLATQFYVIACRAKK